MLTLFNSKLFLFNISLVITHKLHKSKNTYNPCIALKFFILVLYLIKMPRNMEYYLSCFDNDVSEMNRI